MSDALPDGDEATRFGARLREFRESRLEFSVAELAVAVGVNRTYLYDCERGRRFASRSLLDKLVVFDSRATALIPLYEDLARHRDWRMRRPNSLLASQIAEVIHQGFPAIDIEVLEPPEGGLPPDFAVIQGRAGCFGLLEALVASAQLDRPGTIVLSLPSFEDELFDQKSWWGLLQRALEAGWTVVQLHRERPDSENQIRLILRVLSFVGTSDQYHPIVLPNYKSKGSADVPRTNFAVVEFAGAVQLFADTGAIKASAVFHPWTSGPHADACEAFLSHGQRLRDSGKELVKVHASWRRDEDGDAPNRPLPGKVTFDLELTAAEQSMTRHALVKSGLLVSTMPPSVAQTQLARWKAHVRNTDPEYEGYIDILAANRTRRWDALQSSSSRQARDICTKSAVQSYLAEDDAAGREHWLFQLDPLYSGKWLTRDERVAHVRALIDLVASNEISYELGLADNPTSLPLPLGNSYWQANDAGIFFVTVRHESDVDSALYGSIRDASTVAAFFDLFDLLWEELPMEGRDQKAVLRWLREQVAQHG